MMDESGTISTRNPMKLWGDRGKYEGKDADSEHVPKWTGSRLRVVIVTKGKERK